VVPDDVKDLAIPVLAHRIILEPESELEGVSPADYLRKILNEVVVFQ
jgi:MoxR-like ATPase